MKTSYANLVKTTCITSQIIIHGKKKHINYQTKIAVYYSHPCLSNKGSELGLRTKCQLSTQKGKKNWITVTNISQVLAQIHCQKVSQHS